MSYEVDDNRYPASAVVYIEATWGNATYTGSGVLVGRNDVLTAAHVIYNISLGGLGSNIRVYPSFDPDDRVNDSHYPTKITYFPNFDPDGDGFLVSGDLRLPTFAGSEYDIALLSLSRPLGDTYGTFGIDWSYRGGSVGVIGHPGLYGTNMTYDDGSVTRSNVDANFRIGADLEINPGNSGGPIYYDYGNGPYVVGIVSTRSTAVAVGDHYYWLNRAIVENDFLIAPPGRPPNYVFEIARLYEAGLDRRFDAGGLNYWIDQYEIGRSLQSLAAVFLDSAEFTTRFGDDDRMTASQFVRQMYLNVLDRQPDQSGLSYWIDTMSRGTSREAVLVDFALSPENVQSTGYLANLREANAGYWDL